MTTAAPCRVRVCTHTRSGAGAHSCGARGSGRLLAHLQAEAEAGRLPARVEDAVCFGHCTAGPNVKVVGGALLHAVDPDHPAAVRHAVAAVVQAAPAAVGADPDPQVY